MSESPDHDELLSLIENLEESAAAIRDYGERHDVPAVERTAKRIQGAIAALRQNVPGGLTRHEK